MQAQVCALKPGAVGLGMGGIAPGEVLPSEEQMLGTEAPHNQKPLLLTDGKHGGDAASRVQTKDVGASSKAPDSAARQTAITESASAAAAAACTTEALQEAAPVTGLMSAPSC